MNIHSEEYFPMSLGVDNPILNNHFSPQRSDGAVVDRKSTGFTTKDSRRGYEWSRQTAKYLYANSGG